MLQDAEGKMGQSLPEECSPAGEADDWAIVVSLSERTTLVKAWIYLYSRS